MLVRTLWFYLALCCVQRVVEAAEGCGEETVMWTDRLDDFHLKTFYLCCLHLRQPPEAESKSIIKKSVPRWFQSFKPALTVCFVVNNKPRLLPALCSLWVQRGSRVPLCRFRRAFPRRGAAQVLLLLLLLLHCCVRRSLIHILLGTVRLKVHLGGVVFFRVAVEEKQKYSRRLPRRHLR